MDCEWIGGITLLHVRHEIQVLKLINGIKPTLIIRLTPTAQNRFNSQTNNVPVYTPTC